MTRVVKTDRGYGIEINGEIVENGFLNERMAKRAVKHAETEYKLYNDPDFIEFNAYRDAMTQVKFWKELRASIGDTANPEDDWVDAESEDYINSMAEANERIAQAEAEAEKHLEGAKRWAEQSGISL